MNILETRNLTLVRDTANSFAYPDIFLSQKDRCLLTGHSGSGKTTLLSILAGLLPPGSGTVTFKGENIYSLNNKERDRLRGQSMGFIFQTLHLIPSLTVRQNIALAADMAGKDHVKGRTDELLSQLGLLHKGDSLPQKLSQGEQQRAAIARAVYNKPAIIIADEPTSALDHTNARAVIDLLVRQAEQTGAALLVASHDDRITDAFTKIIPLDDCKKAA